MTATIVAEAYKCQKCQTHVSPSLAQGWLAYDTETQGGRAIRVRLCPNCRPGAQPPAADDETTPKTGWSATCNNCYESLSERDYPDGVTQADAEQWTEDHQCEPSTEVIPPKAPR